jgi:hypothetical protein
LPDECPVNTYVIKNITDVKTNTTISATGIAHLDNQGLLSTIIDNPSKDYNIYV